MKQTISLNDFMKNHKKYTNFALNWSIFIYPTDTIYWIWWVFPSTLKKIYKIKNRNINKKVSIIIPAKDIKDFLYKISNISKNNICIDYFENLIIKLWNKWIWFTFIIKAKNSFFNNLDSFWQLVYKDKTIWIRFLNHPFQKFINTLNKPFITTSANLSSEKVITDIRQLDKILFNNVDYIIDWWKLSNKPSYLIFWNKKIKKR